MVLGEDKQDPHTVGPIKQRKNKRTQIYRLKREKGNITTNTKKKFK